MIKALVTTAMTILTLFHWHLLAPQNVRSKERVDAQVQTLLFLKTGTNVKTY